MKKEQKNKRLYELRKKSPAVAVVLSLLIVGAGQWYCGRFLRGLGLMVASLVLWLFGLGWIIWVLAPIDAYCLTKNTNEELMLELGLYD